jgi:sigma-B regulation protein RsbU (phosphoserine phosphatase)
MEGAPIRILIADDDPVTRRLLLAALAPPAYEPVEVSDGAEAYRTLQGGSAPSLAILDWLMPGMPGIEICRRVREEGGPNPPYLILLTFRGRTADITAGFEAGADDYVVKPFEPHELRARVNVGVRIVGLQQTLAGRIAALEEALAGVKTLQGLLPICAWCKKIRNDGQYWQQVESYITEHSDARFSHSICPDCREKHVVPELERLRQRPRTE